MEETNANIFMQKKKKLFPWIKKVHREFFKSFPGDYDVEALKLFHNKMEQELQNDCLNQTPEKTKALFATIGYFYNHFCWKIKWEKDSPHMKASCVKVLSNLTKLGILLSKGNLKSRWLNKILSAIEVFPGGNDLLYNALLNISRLKKKYQETYGVILKHVLCSGQHKIEEPDTYLKLMLLFRRMKLILKNGCETTDIVSLAISVKTPPKTVSWLIAHNFETFGQVEVSAIGKQIMGRGFSNDIISKLREILLPETCFERAQILKVNRNLVPDTSDHFFIDGKSGTEIVPLHERVAEISLDLPVVPQPSRKKNLKRRCVSKHINQESETLYSAKNIPTLSQPESNIREITDHNTSPVKKKKLDLTRKSKKHHDNITEDVSTNRQVQKKKLNGKPTLNCEAEGIECIQISDSSENEKSLYHIKPNTNILSVSNENSKRRKKAKLRSDVQDGVQLNSVDNFLSTEMNKSENVYFDHGFSTKNASSIVPSLKQKKKKKLKTTNTMPEKCHSKSKVQMANYEKRVNSEEDMVDNRSYLSSITGFEKASARKKSSKEKKIYKLKSAIMPEGEFGLEKTGNVNSESVNMDADLNTSQADVCSPLKKSQKNKKHQTQMVKVTKNNDIESEAICFIDNTPDHSIHKKALKRKNDAEVASSDLQNHELISESVYKNTEEISPKKFNFGEALTINNELYVNQQFTNSETTTECPRLSQEILPKPDADQQSVEKITTEKHYLHSEIVSKPDTDVDRQSAAKDSTSEIHNISSEIFPEPNTSSDQQSTVKEMTTECKSLSSEILANSNTDGEQHSVVGKISIESDCVHPEIVPKAISDADQQYAIKKLNMENHSLSLEILPKPNTDVEQQSAVKEIAIENHSMHSEIISKPDTDVDRQSAGKDSTSEIHNISSEIFPEPSTSSDQQFTVKEITTECPSLSSEILPNSNTDGEQQSVVEKISIESDCVHPEIVPKAISDADKQHAVKELTMENQSLSSEILPKPDTDVDQESAVIEIAVESHYLHSEIISKPDTNVDGQISAEETTVEGSSMGSEMLPEPDVSVDQQATLIKITIKSPTLTLDVVPNSAIGAETTNDSSDLSYKILVEHVSDISEQSAAKEISDTGLKPATAKEITVHLTNPDLSSEVSKLDMEPMTGISNFVSKDDDCSFNSDLENSQTQTTNKNENHTLDIVPVEEINTLSEDDIDDEIPSYQPVSEENMADEVPNFQAVLEEDTAEEISNFQSTLEEDRNDEIPSFQPLPDEGRSRECSSFQPILEEDNVDLPSSNIKSVEDQHDALTEFSIENALEFGENSLVAKPTSLSENNENGNIETIGSVESNSNSSSSIKNECIDEKVLSTASAQEENIPSISGNDAESDIDDGAPHSKIEVQNSPANLNTTPVEDLVPSKSHLKYVLDSPQHSNSIETNSPTDNRSKADIAKEKLFSHKSDLKNVNVSDKTQNSFDIVTRNISKETNTMQVDATEINQCIMSKHEIMSNMNKNRSVTNVPTPNQQTPEELNSLVRGLFCNKQSSKCTPEHLSPRKELYSKFSLDAVFHSSKENNTNLNKEELHNEVIVGEVAIKAPVLSSGRTNKVHEDSEHKVNDSLDCSTSFSSYETSRDTTRETDDKFTSELSHTLVETSPKIISENGLKDETNNEINRSVEINEKILVQLKEPLTPKKDSSDFTTLEDCVLSNNVEELPTSSEIVESVTQVLNKKEIENCNQLSSEAVDPVTEKDTVTGDAVSYVMAKVLRQVEVVDFASGGSAFESLKNILKSNLKLPQGKFSSPIPPITIDDTSFSLLGDRKDCLSFLDVYSNEMNSQENISCKDSKLDNCSSTKSPEFCSYRNVVNEMVDDKSESTISEIVNTCKFEKSVYASDDNNYSDSEDESMNINDDIRDPLVYYNEKFQIKSSESYNDAETIISKIDTLDGSKSREIGQNIDEHEDKISKTSNLENDINAARSISKIGVKVCSFDSEKLSDLLQTMPIAVVNIGNRCDDKNLVDQEDNLQKDFGISPSKSNELVHNNEKLEECNSSTYLEKSEKPFETVNSDNDCMLSTKIGKGIISSQIKEHAEESTRVIKENYAKEKESNPIVDMETYMSHLDLQCVTGKKILHLSCVEPLDCKNRESSVSTKLKKVPIQSTLTNTSKKITDYFETPSKPATRMSLRNKTPSTQKPLPGVDTDKASASCYSLRRSSRRPVKDVNVNLGFDFDTLSLDSPKPKRSGTYQSSNDGDTDAAEGSPGVQSNDSIESLKENHSKTKRRTTRSSSVAVVENRDDPKSSADGYNLRSKRSLILPGKLNI